MPVHQIGLPCDMEAILESPARHGLPVVEDAACAIGSEVRFDGRWERIGRPHGTVACFSFHPRKIITTGDGGMLTTSDAELDRQFRLLRQHAMSVPDTVRHAAKTVVFEEYPSRLQLPDDGHPGGRRPGPAAAAAGHPARARRLADRYAAGPDGAAPRARRRRRMPALRPDRTTSRTPSRVAPTSR